MGVVVIRGGSGGHLLLGYPADEGEAEAWRGGAHVETAGSK